MERPAGRLGEAAAQGQRLARQPIERPALVLDDDEDHAINPRRRSTSTTRGAASGPSPRISTALSCSTGTRSRILRRRSGRRIQRDLLDLLLPRAQAARDRRVARQVDAFLDGHDRGPRDLVDLPAATGRLAPGDDRVIADLEALRTRHDRPVEGDGDPHPDLVVAGVGGLVAEQDQVERAVDRLAGTDRIDDRRRGRDRPPLPAVGLQQDGAIDADRHRLAQLVGRLFRPEGQDRARSAMRLDDPDRLLDRALLVRADREPEVAGVDRLLVGGQGDLPGRGRDALDADEDVHVRP